MGKWIKCGTRWVRNPYEHINPWVRQMVNREPEIYWNFYKRGYTLDDPAIEDRRHTCPFCKQDDAWHRNTVGKIICHSCGAMYFGSSYDLPLVPELWEACTHDRCTYEGGSCPKPPNSCKTCEFMARVAV